MHGTREPLQVAPCSFFGLCTVAQGPSSREVATWSMYPNHVILVRIIKLRMILGLTKLQMGMCQKQNSGFPCWIPFNPAPTRVPSKHMHTHRLCFSLIPFGIISVLPVARKRAPL